MTTFVISPTDHAANSATAAVRKSLETRRYEHYILVHGKRQGKATVLSHIDITKDRNKAEEFGYLTPAQWLDIFNNKLKYMVGKTS